MHHTRLFSEVLENGTRISSIPKADNSRENSDFRPISILLLMSEVYEKLVLRQMATYLSNNAILESNISAYRTGHSTTTAMFAAIRDDIISAMNKEEIMIAVTANFSKAFDTATYEAVFKNTIPIRVLQACLEMVCQLPHRVDTIL